jgi:translation initiation factor 6
MRVKMLNISGDAAVGLYLVSNDDYTLIPPGLSEEAKQIIESTLGTTLVETTAGGYRIPGAFSVMTNNYLLLSNIYTEEEINHLRQELDMAIYVLDSDINVIANTVLVHDNKALISYLYSQQLEEELQKLLGVEVERIRLGPVDVFAQYLVPLEDKLLAAPIYSKDELKFFADKLGLERIVQTTVNRGSIFLRSGMVANSKGILLGDLTTPIEYEQIMS